MAVNLSPVGGVAAQFFTNTGAVLTGGKLYTYAAGTTTPATTYTSGSGAIPWTNPIVLDAAGRVSGSGEIWLTDGISYKFVLKDSTDVLIATYDNITGINSNFVNFVAEQEIQTATAGQTVFTLTTTEYQPGTNTLSVFVDGVNQYGPGAQYAYTETSSTVVTFTNGLHVGAVVKFTTTQTLSGGTLDSSQVVYDPPFTGSVATNVEAKLAQTISIADFGAVCDGVTDDTDAVQAAIDYCASFSQWPTLIVPGRCRLASSVNIDRPVDTETTEFFIVGNGPGAGFYTDGNVTMFTSTIAMPGLAPVTEFVTFQNIVFETSSLANESFVLSQKFLRIRFVDCVFQIIRCVVAQTYIQTYYFNNCNIRNTKNNFINCYGLYDVTFESCVIELGGTVVRSIDDSLSTYGTSGLRFVNNVIEGLSQSIVNTSGVSGFDCVANHIEFCLSPYFNFAGDTAPTSASINISGNYIACNHGEIAFSYGTTTGISSTGNTLAVGAGAGTAYLHELVGTVTNLISVGDAILFGTGAISNAAYFSVVNGVYRGGTAIAAWTDSANQINKDTSGNFGIGTAAQTANRFLVVGADQTSTKYAGAYLDSAGNTIMAFRNDRLIQAPALQNFANDTAAAAGGIPVGYLYRNGSVVQVRVS